MATDKKFAPNIDNSEPVLYPNGRIKDNTGSGDGTPVNRLIYGDLHEFFAKLMRLANIAYNGLPDNETNGYQLVSALIALAGKNDYVYTLSSVSGTINIATDLSIVKSGEVLLTKAGFDYTTETNIKGSGSSLYGVSIPSSFKNNDYLLLVCNGSTFTLQRLADASNIDVLASELLYLKAATTSEEFAGASNSKATTPYTNQLAFARRVIGLDSGLFLATPLRNGLMSKEDKALLDNLQDPVRNRGWFSGLDVGLQTQIGTQLPKSGDIVSATVYAANGTTQESYIRVVVANSMSSNNYFVRLSIESEGDLGFDDDCLAPVFRKETNTQFVVAIGAVQASVQNIKIHIEVVQL